MTTQRNALGPAYTHAEGLYDNTATLIFLLDAWSYPGRSPELSPEAIAHIQHNLVNAKSRLASLAEALRPFLPEEEIS